MTGLQRITIAVAYIENHLNGELNVEEVAAQAYCSKFHFHRMFYAYVGITCGEYIRKRKLSLAAAELVNSSKRIIDIAQQYGYASPNAFTRAFIATHGVTPSEARKQPIKLVTFNRVDIESQHRKQNVMHYTVVDIPEFNVIGKSQRFTFDQFVK